MGGMLTEKGTLPFGIEDKDGVRHREFEMRPRLVKDTVEIAREQGMQRLEGDDVFFSLCLTAKQILHIGEIQPVPVDMLLDLYDEDLAAINTTKEVLAGRLESFRVSIAGGGEESMAVIATGADTPGAEDRSDAAKDPASDGRDS